MIDKDDFDRWKADPVTKTVIKFLKDQNQSLLKFHEDEFLNEVVPDPKELVKRMERYQILAEIITLELSDMEKFYETSMG